MQNDSSDLSFCPSFNSYAVDNKLLDIAALLSPDSQYGAVSDGEEFEFINPCENQNTTKTAPFPIFDRGLLLNGDGEDEYEQVEEAIRIPLRNLFIGDRDVLTPSSSSSSSSEADELEGVANGTYCVWKPKQPAVDQSSPSRCQKSRSTGSSSKESKRWRLKDLLKRSNSDGKVSSSSSPFLFMNIEKRNSMEKKGEEKTKSAAAAAAAAMKKKGEGEKVTATTVKRVGKVSAHEVFYVKSKAIKDGNKRRSYLPYRPDLLGFFPNVNS